MEASSYIRAIKRFNLAILSLLLACLYFGYIEDLAKDRAARLSLLDIMTALIAENASVADSKRPLRGADLKSIYTEAKLFNNSLQEFQAQNAFSKQERPTSWWEKLLPAPISDILDSLYEIAGLERDPKEIVQFLVELNESNQEIHGLELISLQNLHSVPRNDCTMAAIRSRGTGEVIVIDRYQGTSAIIPRDSISLLNLSYSCPAYSLMKDMLVLPVSKNDTRSHIAIPDRIYGRLFAQRVLGMSASNEVVVTKAEFADGWPGYLSDYLIFSNENRASRSKKISYRIVSSEQLYDLLFFEAAAVSGSAHAGRNQNIAFNDLTIRPDSRASFFGINTTGPVIIRVAPFFMLALLYGLNHLLGALRRVGHKSNEPWIIKDAYAKTEKWIAHAIMAFAFGAAILAYLIYLYVFGFELTFRSARIAIDSYWGALSDPFEPPPTLFVQMYSAAALVSFFASLWFSSSVFVHLKALFADYRPAELEDKSY